jgi:hypothetical protein
MPHPAPLGAVTVKKWKKSNGRRETPINADENEMPIGVHLRSSAAHQCFLSGF